MENLADSSENYWHRSTRKAFSFDDDDNDDDVIRSNVGGTVIGGSGSGILNDDAISEASFDSTALAGSLNFSINTVISEETLQLILKEQTLDETIENFISKGVTPEEELKFLRRKIQTVLYHPSAESTAHKLLLGKNVSLENFKSLHEKEHLLDEMLKYNAGDAIVYVLLFCKRTLNSKKFNEVLLTRPKALRQYISYLQQGNYTQEAWELLQLCGKPHEAALMQFKGAMLSNDLATRKTKLSQLVKRYNTEAVMTVVPLYEQTFSNALKLINLVELERNGLDNKIDLNSTPVEILYACCSKHVNWKEADMKNAISPYRVAAEQQISPALFEWTALNERARAQAYADLECIFERSSSWHHMKQKQFHISFSLETAIRRLHELKAPTTVLYIFLSKMKDGSDKLELARRVNCTKAVIDALVGMKDAPQLAILKETLTERSEEQFYCEKAIKTLQSKRWSTENIKLKL